MEDFWFLWFCFQGDCQWKVKTDRFFVRSFSVNSSIGLAKGLFLFFSERVFWCHLERTLTIWTTSCLLFCGCIAVTLWSIAVTGSLGLLWLFRHGAGLWGLERCQLVFAGSARWGVWESVSQWKWFQDLHRFLFEFLEKFRGKSVGCTWLKWVFLPLIEFFGASGVCHPVSEGEDNNPFERLCMSAGEWLVFWDFTKWGVRTAGNLCTKSAWRVFKSRFSEVSKSCSRLFGLWGFASSAAAIPTKLIHNGCWPWAFRQISCSEFCGD